MFHSWMPWIELACEKSMVVFFRHSCKDILLHLTITTFFRNLTPSDFAFILFLGRIPLGPSKLPFGGAMTCLSKDDFVSAVP